MIGKKLIASWDKMPQGTHREDKMEMVFDDILADMRRFERNANGKLGWPISVSEFLDAYEEYAYEKDRNNE